MVSPALEAFLESLSTLKFANRAKNIKNQPRINEDLDEKTLLRRFIFHHSNARPDRCIENIPRTPPVSRDASMGLMFTSAH